MNNGGPAFPIYDHHGNGQQFLSDVGMSLRDYFAAQAMQGMLADPTNNRIIDLLAVIAYRVADAMLAAREAK